MVVLGAGLSGFWGWFAVRMRRGFGRWVERLTGSDAGILIFQRPKISFKAVTGSPGLPRVGFMIPGTSMFRFIFVF